MTTDLQGAAASPFLPDGEVPAFTAAPEEEAPSPHSATTEGSPPGPSITGEASSAALTPHTADETAARSDESSSRPTADIAEEPVLQTFEPILPDGTASPLLQPSVSSGKDTLRSLSKAGMDNAVSLSLAWLHGRPLALRFLQAPIASFLLAQDGCTPVSADGL